MRILFVDGTSMDYTATTPAQRPLGGMQSALCYLACTLAARGHDVALFNRGNKTPGVYGGVSCAGFEALSPATLNSFDVVVSISTGSLAFRQQLGLIRPLVLWTQHDTDRPAVDALRDGVERYLWDKIVLVSQWQSDRYRAEFKIKPEQITILRNAVAPAFEKLHRDQPYFFECDRAPVLYYSSTPYRGLDVLLAAFPLIRTLVPDCEARIYSSMSVYQVPRKEEEPYRPLYELCRATDGVHYVGSLGQTALAQAMTRLDILAYPNTYPETSCITLMEAMAGGCLMLCSALGALPETAAGFASLCEWPANETKEQLAERYARFVARAIDDARRHPDIHAKRIDAQRAFALKSCSWSSRAAEWEGLLSNLAGQRVRATAPRRNEPCPCGSGERFKRCCGAAA
jgi:glycosyltransferase involved in cell wall biosynthesis